MNLRKTKQRRKKTQWVYWPGYARKAGLARQGKWQPGPGDELEAAHSALERRAIFRGWAVPDVYKAQIIQRQYQIATDPATPPLVAVAACRALLAADARQTEIDALAIDDRSPVTRVGAVRPDDSQADAAFDVAAAFAALAGSVGGTAGADAVRPETAGVIQQPTVPVSGGPAVD